MRRRLLEVGLKEYKTRKKSFLSHVNKKKRLEFAKTYKSWIPEDWAQNVWSDESNFEEG